MGRKSKKPIKQPPPRLTEVPRENLVTVGGAIQDATVSLRFFGDDLIPADITKLLGAAPTEARKKGDVIQRSRYHLKARTGSWLLKSALDRRTELSDQISGLLDQVTSDSKVWHKLTTRYSADLFCGLFLDEFNRGFNLPPTLVARLAKLGLGISFDIYGPVSE